MRLGGVPRGAGFATIDFETTGLFPEHHDRAIEIAVVHSDPDGTITGAWETLINPRRDLGPQGIHGISAREVIAAPHFGLIAGELLELLSGRVVVAHNASFDTRFLAAELSRLDYWPGATMSSACTMRLSRQYLGTGGSLADCCAAFDIPLDGAHRAAVDALATARLLEGLIASSRHDEWADLLMSAAELPGYDGERAAWVAREGISSYTPSFLHRIVDRVPDVSTTDEQSEYLSLVERCLLDRYLSEHEKNALVELASRYGIGRAAVEHLHQTYFRALTAVAWEDGVLTDEERDDLGHVALLLEVPEGLRDDLLAAAPPAAEVAVSEFRLHPGDAVVLTGDMARGRSEWEAALRERGYVPKPAVTKAVKLVVAADPDSLSGKARKARDYGIPIVGEAWLEAHVDAAGR